MVPNSQITLRCIFVHHALAPGEDGGLGAVGQV